MEFFWILVSETNGKYILTKEQMQELDQAYDCQWEVFSIEEPPVQLEGQTKRARIWIMANIK